MATSHLSPDTALPAGMTRAAVRRVLVASKDAADAEWLQSRVGHALLAEHCKLSIEAVMDALHVPTAVAVVAFDARTDLQVSSQLVQWLRKYKPEVTPLGMGYANSAPAPLAALRAGVKDFLDIGTSEIDDIRKPVWEACMRVNVEPAPPEQGKVLALVGARAGMGVTTLAVHLCAALSALQDEAERSSGHEALSDDLGVGLLDLGFPLRDGQMLLGLNGGFHMVDAVQGVNRIDKAMLDAALPRHSSGTAVLSWPAQAHALREVSPLTIASIVQKMRGFFAWQVVDVGGFPSPEIVQEVIRSADRVLAVTDQSIGGIVSLSELLKSLRANAASKGVDGLVVNRAFKSQGLPPLDIAKRLELPLRYVIPHREEALLKSSSLGLLLSENAPNDAYVQEVKKMAQALLGPGETRALAKTGKGWLPQLLRKKRLA